MTPKLFCGKACVRGKLLWCQDCSQQQTSAKTSLFLFRAPIPWGPCSFHSLLHNFSIQIPVIKRMLRFCTVLVAACNLSSRSYLHFLLVHKDGCFLELGFYSNRALAGFFCKDKSWFFIIMKIIIFVVALINAGMSRRLGGHFWYIPSYFTES